MLRTNYVRDNKILEMKVTRMLKEEISKVRSGTLGVPLISIFLDKIINAGAQFGVWGCSDHDLPKPRNLNAHTDGLMFTPLGVMGV